jgi:hypothetical protein
VVGANGFEPSTSWSRTRRASQAALRPDGHANTESKQEIQLNTGSVPAERSFNVEESAHQKAAGKLSLSGGPLIRTVPGLELVAQCELHRAWVGQQSSVITEVAGIS